MRYEPHPRVAAVLQFFNKRQNIPMLAQGLKASGVEEIIVLEDGSVDDSTRRWQAHLKHPNHILIRTNDLYEVIGYDRALRYSNAEFVVLLQDDDEMPSDSRWVQRALSHFEAHPELVYLGGHHAMEILPREQASQKQVDWVIDGDVHSIAGIYKQRITKPGVEENAFRFVMAAVRAPVFLRRKEFLEIGGIDLDFAPFMCDDVDSCLRLWLSGYKVGVFNAEFNRDIGLGGMRAFNKATFGAQTIKNWHKIYAKHGAAIEDGSVKAMVDRANRVLDART